ncbi:MAG: hypothetical protein M3R72_11615, partial [Bacteroidota bacterium]|nr:hypothetical protein [Bacteroidota bacterium]
VSDQPLLIQKRVIDLFNPELPVLSQKKVQLGEQSFLFDLNQIKNKQTPQVLCAASRVTDEKREAHGYSFVAKSPDSTNNVMRILLPAKPQSVIVTKPNGEAIKALFEWDEASHTCLLRFMNASEGRSVIIKW